MGELVLLSFSWPLAMVPCKAPKVDRPSSRVPGGLATLNSADTGVVMLLLIVDALPAATEILAALAASTDIPPSGTGESSAAAAASALG